MLVSAISMLLAAQAAPAATPAANTKAAVEARVRAGFARRDINKDGFVDKAEADRDRSAGIAAAQARYRQTRAAQFARIDTNKDGSISRAEFESVGAPRAAGGSNPWMDNFDIDKNGRVALAEVVAKTKNEFDLLDRNKDGTVTAAEMRAAQPRQAPRR